MTFILFVVLLLVIVMIHELGHMLVAKAFNVYCHEFSFGMGPRICSIKGKETVYSIRAIPIGGFVAMAGDGDEEYMQDKDIVIPSERTITGAAPWKRLLIFSAGIIMNVVLAIVIMAMIFLSYGAVSVSPDASIGAVEAGSPAEAAGLKAGDLITDIELPDGERFDVDSFANLGSYLSMYEGEGSMLLTVENEEGSKVIEIVPEYNKEEGRYMIGISSGGYTIQEVNILNCWGLSIEYCISNVTMIVNAIANLLRGTGYQNVSGVVGMYETTDQVIQMGMDYYFQLIAIISLNLGVMNALPVPMLDGGRILILLIEMAIGRPLNKKVVNYIMTASMILLLGLMLLVTIKDVVNLF